MSGHKKIDQTLNHLFRQEAGRMVSVMVKLFGIQNYDLAEDVVQSALTSALETWKYRGIPENPRAWLYRAAKNKAIDILRHKKLNTALDPNLPEHQLLTSGYTMESTMNKIWEESHIKDDFLAMMYACCLPEISEENQVTFILKSLCGFSTREIAKTFLTTEETISKRIYRTKEYFREKKIRPELPDSKDVASRTAPVLSCIYLMYNEGYNSTHSDELIRREVITQAMMLCKSLLDHPATRIPEVYALMSLMCFHTARATSRISSEGDLILLSDQDRSQWDREMIEAGNDYMNKAAFGKTLSTYHLEAAIAYEHCIAPRFKKTNWQNILKYYDLIIKQSPSPVLYLNRAVAVLEMFGPHQADDAVNHIPGKKSLEKYYLYHSIQGEIQSRLGNDKQAEKFFEKAETLTHSTHEKKFLAARRKNTRD